MATVGPPKSATSTGGLHAGQWERRTEWPLVAAALVFLVAYALPILEPSCATSIKTACSVIIYGIWALFGIDYLVRLGLSDRRWRFVAHHLPDLLSVALPVLRPLRLLRLIALVRALNRGAIDTLRGRVATYVSSSTLLLVSVATLAVLDAERGKPGSNINTVGDALWWTVSTIATVGYGDRVPVTFEGRCVAVGLMLGGITLIGVVTASIASWLIAQVRDAEDDTQAAIHREIAQVEQRLAGIEAALASLQSQLSAASVRTRAER